MGRRDQNAKTMKPVYILLVALFVLLSALADALLVHRLAANDTPTLLWLAGLSFGQLGLVTAWFIFGRAPMWAKLAALPITVFLLGGFLAKGSTLTHVEWRGFLALYVVGELALLLWLRLSGLRMVGNDSERDAAPDSERRAWQFSLAGLLSTMTLVCLAAGVVRWIKPHDWRTVLLYCAGFVPITCIALWTVWSERWLVVVRIALAVPAIVLLSLALGPIEGRGGIDWNLLLLACVQYGYVIVGSIIARIGGLQLAWLPKR